MSSLPLLIYKIRITVVRKLEYIDNFVLKKIMEKQCVNILLYDQVPPAHCHRRRFLRQRRTRARRRRRLCRRGTTCTRPSGGRHRRLPSSSSSSRTSGTTPVLLLFLRHYVDVYTCSPLFHKQLSLAVTPLVNCCFLPSSTQNLSLLTLSNHRRLLLVFRQPFAALPSCHVNCFFWLKIVLLI